MDFIRRPTFLSPSALQLWRKDKEAYFLRYLCHDRPPQLPQTQPMSVGSAFDAFVKNFLHRWIYGDRHPDSQFFDLRAIFERQVEEHNRDFAWKAGETCFVAYQQSGALKALMNMLEAGTNVRMEFTEEQNVDGVVILGKPDLAWTTRQQLEVVKDWKVSGFCSQSGASPVPGYVEMFNDQGRRLGPHRDACLWHEKDLQINSEPNIEIAKVDWAVQLSSYGWITGIQVGAPMYVAVDQLVCKPGAIRVAQHRCEITREFQLQAHAEFLDCWQTIHSNHIFRDLTLTESVERCQVLYRKAKAYIGDDANTQWLRDQAAKRHRRF